MWEAGSGTSSGHGSVDTGKTFPGRMGIELQSSTREADIAEKPSKSTNFRMTLGFCLAVCAPPCMYLYSLLPIYAQDAYQENLPVSIALFVVVGATLYTWGKAAASRIDGDLQKRIADWEQTWRCDRCAKSFMVE